MSQASKHIDWCLKKAEKEIEECKKLNKRPKHRGLLKINPDLEEAKEHIEKAIHDLEVTEYFYSMYHCFLAIAAKFGYESNNQTCTIALIEYLKKEGMINLDNQFIEMFKYKEDKEEKKDSIIEMREDYTYNTKLYFNEKKIDELIKTCKDLIEATKMIIFE